ncbi:alpha/beta fold hydrolase [Microvirga sp. VF16]|uniref:alpha/beta fold hydrolase n=1 Tax=Microvirga sp. VF16 TaxID=2807101 RepID=UPI00193E8D03|nr:alpha/beta fold hydrolase [Microvirga sp. VF16]QRM29221.1 alpha/beta fold hydrolase [Microvirga sp. VF16]
MSERPTVVLLPGLLCDASIWEAQRAALEPHADIRIADFSQLDSIEAMARSALALADGPLIAIGHSMGARVAMEMVRLAPERIEKLALIDTGVDARREGEEAKRQAMIDLAFAEGMGALADRWLPPMVHEDRIGDRTLLAPLKAMVMRATPEQHDRQIQALLNRPNVRPHLPSIACPTLVMVGRQDRWSPLAQHEEMASLIPGAELVVIEDSGHMSLLEQPDQVSEALLRFLGFTNENASANRAAGREAKPMAENGDRIPDTPLFDRKRSLRGYRINKMAMGLSNPANREAFRENESAYLDRFGLTSEEKDAVMTRNWREMVRLGGNLFFILKISAVDPVRITEIGAHQAGMEHADFLRDRLGKK